MNTRHNTLSFSLSSISINGEEEKSEPIHFDLIIEMLTRLPSKSIARFSCLSKLCDSTLRGPHFTDSFFTISSSRPKLLLSCLRDGETFFFSCSSPQPQISSPLVANFQMSFPSNCPSHICRPVRGLVCGLNQQTVPLICNPSTGQFFSLPEVEKPWEVRKNCIGYDPIGKQFKALCITFLSGGSDASQTCEVLTLGTGKKLSWRMIKCDIPHYPSGVDGRNYYYVYDEICINGVCYYFARFYMEPDYVRGIVCFDVRFEKFKLIRAAQDRREGDIDKRDATLVNYKDKLANLQLKIVDGIFTGTIQLWVLEDAEKHKWSSYIYVLPPPWKSIVEETKLCIVGRNTRTGEIVLSPSKMLDSFYLLYYNPERNTITKVEIQGMEAFEDCQVYTFLDHVEDVKRMTSV